MTPLEKRALNALEPLSERERELVNRFCDLLSQARPKVKPRKESLTQQALAAGVVPCTYIRRLKKGLDPVTGKAE